MKDKSAKNGCVFYDESDGACRIHEQLERFEIMFDAISDAIVVADVDRKIFSINRGLATTFGYTIEDLEGKSTSILYESEEEYIKQGKIRFNLSAEEKSKPYVVNYRRKNGEIFPGETIGTAVKNSAGETIEFIGVIRDITERQLAQDAIRQLAMTDSLTGLANRYYFNRRFEDSLKLAARQRHNLAVVMLDLDKFKPVNDTYGHQVGDELLREVAIILKDCSREVDVVARVGGDEFMLLLVGITEISDIEQIAKRIINEITTPFQLSGEEINIGVSVGIAIYPNDATEKESLIQMADLALYEVKKSGGNNLKFYSPGLIEE